MASLWKRKVIVYLFKTLFCLLNLQITLQQESANIGTTPGINASTPLNQQTNTDSSVSPNATTTATTSKTMPKTNSPTPLYCQKDWNKNCEEVSGDCLDCTFLKNCIYGKTYNVTCTPLNGVICIKESEDIKKNMICRYCYQTPDWLHQCTPPKNENEPCKVAASPLEYVIVNCTVNDDVICLGHRQFHKRVPCNWTSGYKWSTALIYSITLGGFGADRFYLGHWQQGLGKLFTFGGIGVWTLVDVILIAVGYTRPADGSHYI
ncbi:TM2 domain-containing protein 3-like [Anneissia japonica]|uniref:TM2 domain-containing protein 3-like n=1 Tax=Anneissia japonica TaxID=1529436 RepID=UPI001425A7DE|nr:TM2 domain-containing protein 3-like [Anneissia japonica]